MKIKITKRNGKSVIEVEGEEINISVERENKGNSNGITQKLPAVSSRQALPASSSNEVKYPEIVDDHIFDLDDAEEWLRREDEPKGFLDWIIYILFGPHETKLERIQRIAKELEARHELRDQIIKLVAQKLGVAKALIQARYSVVLEQLSCEAEAQRLKALKAVYEAEEGKSKRELKRAQKVDALTDEKNGQDYSMKSYFDLIEDDALNYLKPDR